MKSATALLLRQTDRLVWTRGEEYARSGRVEASLSDAQEVHAIVRGAEMYHVSLRFAPNGISRECDCAFFKKAGFICKHVVAVAICWDKERGLPIPDSSQIEAVAPQRSTVSKRDIDLLFKKPLQADLALVRILPEATAMGGRSRPHSKLPEAPRAMSVISKLLGRSEVRKCYTELKSWSRRQAFDPYFCSGEMISAFCQVLRIVGEHLSRTPPLVAVQILLDSQAFHKSLVTELVDDSLGLYAISEAHLDEICERIRRINVVGDEALRVEELLKEFERNRGDY
jgi:hypothetical protein